MKSGYKTTEFWMTLAVNLITAAQASGLFKAGTVAMALAFAMSTLTTLGYTYGRAYVKTAAKAK
jgi:hypothetical protein